MKDINKLVEKVKSGDKKAFEELYNLTVAELYWYCKRLCQNDDEAKDLLQETYLSVWRKINGYTDGNFKAWLHFIAHNLWIDSKKKKKEALFSDDEFAEISDDASLNPDDISEQRIRHDEIIKLIDETLNDSQKLTVLMYYYDEKSVGEIAEELNCSEASVKCRLQRAREKLQSKIKDKNLYSISLPLLFMFDSQKADFPDVLNVIRKSIMKKITLASVETKCFISVLSTVALVGGTLAVSDIDLPSKQQPLIKAVDNSVITFCDTSETEFAQTEFYQKTFTEIYNSDTAETENTSFDTEIIQNQANETEFFSENEEMGYVSESNNETFNEMLSSDKTTEINTDISDETTETSKRKYYYAFDDVSDEEIQKWIDTLAIMGKQQGFSEEEIEMFSYPFLINKDDIEESKEN